MDYRITGLDPAPFLPLFGADEETLAEQGIHRRKVDTTPGFPDRITLREAPLGAAVLLLNHCSLPGLSPYHARHAIFLHEGATERYDEVNTIPEVMSRRLLSLRAFDRDGIMRDAEICQGAELEPVIHRLLADPEVVEVHAHNAIRGCYSARITRA